MSQIDPYYQARAKDLTAFLFDEGFLHDDLSRQSIDALEQYLAFVLQSHCEIAVSAAMLVKKIRPLTARSPKPEDGPTTSRSERNSRPINNQKENPCPQSS